MGISAVEPLSAPASGHSRVVEAEWASERPSDLGAFLGPDAPADRPPRILGLFAHPDDEVFCFGGTIARCADAGAVTALVSLTHGEAGQIRDATAASRRSLATVRRKELEESATALGIERVTCLDLGDGRLGSRPVAEVAEVAGSMIEAFNPDVIVTFGPDGGFGHPDHIMSCLATQEAVRQLSIPPRLLHAKFPVRGELMLETLVEWLVESPRRSHSTEAFCNALRLFAEGTSMLGVTADAVRTEWYPPGAYIIEQGEIANELFCILSGTVDVVSERPDGSVEEIATWSVGNFIGEAGIATGQPRNAHVIARDAVTCLVLGKEAPSPAAGRGAGADPSPSLADQRVDEVTSLGVEDCLVVNVRETLDRKVRALSAHRSQYALEPGLLPAKLLEQLLATERFVVTDVGAPVRA